MCNKCSVMSQHTDFPVIAWQCLLRITPDADALALDTIYKRLMHASRADIEAGAMHAARSAPLPSNVMRVPPFQPGLMSTLSVSCAWQLR